MHVCNERVYIVYKLIDLSVLLSVCLSLIFFFIASVNKTMNHLHVYRFPESMLKVPVNTFSHALTPPTYRQTHRGKQAYYGVD